MDVLGLIITGIIMILFGAVWVIVSLWWLIIPVIIIVILLQIRNQNGGSRR